MFDVLVVSSIAVSPSGQRIGKADTLGELEYPILASLGYVSPSTTVITLVHDLQVCVLISNFSLYLFFYIFMYIYFFEIYFLICFFHFSYLFINFNFTLFLHTFIFFWHHYYTLQPLIPPHHAHSQCISTPHIDPSFTLVYLRWSMELNPLPTTTSLST